MEPKLRIVLLGKTGVGKSASGNTILGEKRFTEGLSSGSKTDQCEMQTTEFDGKTLTITDTPGFYHTYIKREVFENAILGATLTNQPGPHVLLLVLSLGSGFSKEDKEVLDTFEKVFTDAKAYTIVLFTNVGQRDVGKFIEKNESLEKFINQSCAEKHVFNNKEKDDAQRTSLLAKIDKVVEKNGGYYTNNMFKEAQKALAEIEKKRNIEAGKGMVLFESVITKGKDVIKENDPGLYKVLEKVIGLVVDMALKCMPKGTS